MKRKTSEILFDYIRDIIYDIKAASIDLNEIDPEHLDVAKGMVFLRDCIKEENTLAVQMAEGNLDVPLPGVNNVLAYPLKSLHASLKHLVWQAKQIQSGDYSQQVDFMGEFSDVFNRMTRELNEQRTQLENHAFRDPLTGLFNRRYIMEILIIMAAEKKQFSLCFADLDNLKYINDKIGHAMGDSFIIDAGKQLETVFHSGIAARVGGDEFMILLPGMSEADAEKCMESVCAALKDYGKREGGETRTVMSYGIVDIKEGNTLSVSRIMARADKKMYTMKAHHKEKFLADENTRDK